MYTPNVHGSFAQALVDGLHDVLEHGRLVAGVKDQASPGSDFGQAHRPTVELISYGFTISDPTSSLFLSESRTLRLPYCFGLLLWSLAGSDDPAWLSYYHPGASKFADDEQHLTGAFGHRLITPHQNMSQIGAIINKIRTDETSRRTAAMISVPEDNLRLSKEHPCGIAVQYLLRDGALHAITHMRSQSALGVLPYDVFLFTGLQRYVAAMLGVQVGDYHHVSGSFHLYASEVGLAEQIVDADAQPVLLGGAFPTGDELERLWNFERTLRTATVRGDGAEVETLMSGERHPSSFAEQTKAVLLMYAMLVLGERSRAVEIASHLPSSLGALAQRYAADYSDARCDVEVST